MIKERYPGISNKLIGLTPEVIVPDVLDHTITQPGGVVVHLVGPKDNCQVIFKSAQGEFSFNTIEPDTKFRIGGAYGGFSHRIDDRGESTISIPPVKKSYQHHPVMAILHEKGHAASHQDPDWVEKLQEAKQQLEVQLFSRALDGFTFLSNDPITQEKEQAALATLCKEERRAWAFALRQIHRLRQEGIDPVPNRRAFKELREVVDYSLENHANPELGIFSTRKKESLWQRITNKALRIPTRENNAAVYVQKYSDARKRVWFNFGLKTTVSTAGWSAVTPIVLEAGAYIVTGTFHPELIAPAMIAGALGGVLYSVSVP